MLEPFKNILNQICSLLIFFDYFNISKNKMIRQVNFVLEKVTSESNSIYSQKIIKVEGQEQQISRALSTKTINMRRKEEENVIRQITKEQKIAALIIRNAIRQYLRKPFKTMLARLIFKKTAYKLLTSKKKRDLQSAFLIIKNYKIKSHHFSLHNFFQRHAELRILSSIIKKKERENLESSFNAMKNLSVRAEKVNTFLQFLALSTNRCIKRCYYSHFFNKLRELDIQSYLKTIQVVDIAKIDELRLYNLKQIGFNKIFDSILLGECQNTSEVRKSKFDEVNSKNATKKQQLAQIRQQLKGLKASMDQQKVNKNRIVQERKKFKNDNKTAMLEATKKFEKQFKDQEAVTKDIEEIYNIRERVISVRDRLRQNSEGSQELCLNLIINLTQCGERIKNLPQLRPQLEEQLNKFKQSQVYLLKTNSLLQKLIQIYEKREPYNYESQYYELQYENNVIKQMIRCFLKEQQYASIHNFIKKQSYNEAQQC